MKSDSVQVRYDAVLLIVAPVVVFFGYYLSPISKWISTKCFSITEEERNKIKSARDIKEEMATMSMVDEFAKYAKLQRKLNQISLDLESSAICRESLQNKVYYWIYGGLSVASALFYGSMLLYVGTSTPVFVGSAQWFSPLSSILAYPTGVEGAISIPMWTLLTSKVISLALR